MSGDCDDAVRDDEKDQRWRSAEEAMAQLRKNPAEWRDYQEEAAAWDITTADGLEELPYEFNVSRTRGGG